MRNDAAASQLHPQLASRPAIQCISFSVSHGKINNNSLSVVLQTIVIPRMSSDLYTITRSKLLAVASYCLHREESVHMYISILYIVLLGSRIQV